MEAQAVSQSRRLALAAVLTGICCFQGPAVADLCGFGFLGEAYLDGPAPATYGITSTVAMFNSTDSPTTDVDIFNTAFLPSLGGSIERIYFDASKTLFEFTPPTATSMTFAHCPDYIDFDRYGVGHFAPSHWVSRADAIERYEELAAGIDFGLIEGVFVHLEVNASCIDNAEVEALVTELREITPQVDFLVGFAVPGWVPGRYDYHLPRSGGVPDVEGYGVHNHGQKNPFTYAPGTDWKQAPFLPVMEELQNRAGEGHYFVGTVSALDGNGWGVQDLVEWSLEENWKGYLRNNHRFRDHFVFPYRPDWYQSSEEFRSSHQEFANWGTFPWMCPHH